MKNRFWKMPRISKHWMLAHLTTGEQHQLINIVKGVYNHIDCLDTLQAMVPASLLQLLQNNADKVDQQSKVDYENLCKKVGGFCTGTI